MFLKIHQKISYLFIEKQNILLLIRFMALFLRLFSKTVFNFYNEQRGIDRFNSLMNLFELAKLDVSMSKTQNKKLKKIKILV